MSIDILPLLTKVYIPAIQSDGRIEWAKIDLGNTVFYQVSYWWNGEQKFCMLNDWEFKIKEK